MSKEGINNLRDFFSSPDERVLDPLFIAQYILVPVNTIVKKYLLVWMQTEYNSGNDQTVCTRNYKAEAYLKYIMSLEYTSVLKNMEEIKKNHISLTKTRSCGKSRIILMVKLISMIQQNLSSALMVLQLSG